MTQRGKIASREICYQDLPVPRGTTLGSEGHVEDHVLTPDSVFTLPLSQKGSKELALAINQGHDAPPLPCSIRFVSALALSCIMFHWITLKRYIIPHLISGKRIREIGADQKGGIFNSILMDQ